MLEEQDIKQIRTVVKEEIGGMRDGVKELGEAIQTLATQVDKRFDAVDKRFDAVDKRFDAVDKRFDNTDKSIDQKIGKLRSDLIDHVTRTVNDAKGDLVKEIRTERERAKLFDNRVLTILERNRLVQPEEAIALRELVV